MRIMWCERSPNVWPDLYKSRVRGEIDYFLPCFSPNFLKIIFHLIFIILQNPCLNSLGQTGTQQQHQPGGRQEKPGRRKTTMNDTLFGERTRNRKNEEIFSDFYTRFLTWPQFFDLFGSELTSGLVQVVLKTGARVDPEAMQVFIYINSKNLIKLYWNFEILPR